VYYFAKITTLIINYLQITRTKKTSIPIHYNAPCLHLNNNVGLIQFRKIIAAYFGRGTDRNLQKNNAVIRNTEAGGAYVGKFRL